MKRFSIFIIIFLVTVGCEKTFFDDNPKNTPESNFEIFWNDFNQNYSQFNLRRVNWDSLYLVNRTKITSRSSDIQLYNVLSELVYAINDMHVSLYTPYGNAYWKSPGFGTYPSNNFINLCKYINCGSTLNNSIFEYRKLINYNVGYIVIYTFTGSNGGLDLADSRYNLIDNILEQFANTDGLIIDVRSNSGGEVFNATAIASRFADKRRVYAKFCIKNGPGKNDFTDWKDQYVEPRGQYQYLKPIVVITSRSTCSAAEQFVLAMKSFPYVTTVGDTTGGGFGLPVYRELPNGWTYRFSTSIGATPEGEIIEGIGVIPDFPVQTSIADSKDNIDRLLEKSIDIMKLKLAQIKQ